MLNFKRAYFDALYIMTLLEVAALVTGDKIESHVDGDPRPVDHILYEGNNIVFVFTDGGKMVLTRDEVMVHKFVSDLLAPQVKEGR